MIKPGKPALKKSPTLGLPGNTTSTEEDFKETKTLPWTVIFYQMNLHRQMDQPVLHSMKCWNKVQLLFPKNQCKGLGHFAKPLKYAWNAGRRTVCPTGYQCSVCQQWFMFHSGLWWQWANILNTVLGSFKIGTAQSLVCCIFPIFQKL